MKRKVIPSVQKVELPVKNNPNNKILAIIIIVIVALLAIGLLLLLGRGFVGKAISYDINLLSVPGTAGIPSNFSSTLEVNTETYFFVGANLGTEDAIVFSFNFTYNSTQLELVQIMHSTNISVGHNSSISLPNILISNISSDHDDLTEVSVIGGVLPPNTLNDSSAVVPGGSVSLVPLVVLRVKSKNVLGPAEIKFTEFTVLNESDQNIIIKVLDAQFKIVPPECVPNCTGKVCGEDDGCGGESCFNLQLDWKNCGTCGTVCSSKNIPYSIDSTCLKGVCKARSCQSGYTLDEGNCVLSYSEEVLSSCKNTSWVDSGNSWVPGRTYNLNNSLFEVSGTCFMLDGAKHVTLDCHNNLINGTMSGYGIVLRDTDDVTIKNCNVSGFKAGISVEQGSNATISNNTLPNESLSINGAGNVSVISNLVNGVSINYQVIEGTNDQVIAGTNEVTFSNNNGGEKSYLLCNGRELFNLSGVNNNLSKIQNCTPLPDGFNNGYICVLNCTGKTCGDDGCGGNCGNCPTGQNCVGGVCVTPDQINVVVSYVGNDGTTVETTLDLNNKDLTLNRSSVRNVLQNIFYIFDASSNTNIKSLESSMGEVWFSLGNSTNLSSFRLDRPLLPFIQSQMGSNSNSYRINYTSNDGSIKTATFTINYVGENCYNSFDDDQDGKTNCTDSDCIGNPRCKSGDTDQDGKVTATDFDSAFEEQVREKFNALLDLNKYIWEVRKNFQVEGGAQ